MNERIQAVVLTNEDVAIQAIVGSIAWLKHRTPAVHINELELGAEVTGW